VGSAGCFPLIVERRKVANVERQDCAALGRRKYKLLLVGSDVVTGLLGGQDVEAPTA
jgi:hypothetical protein